MQNTDTIKVRVRCQRCSHLEADKGKAPADGRPYYTCTKCGNTWTCGLAGDPSEGIKLRNTKREIECLKRLQELSPVYEELIAFFVQEYLLDKEELKKIRSSPDQGKLLQAKMASLSEERKVQLLEYEWSILPVERIKISIVTDRGFKEFIAEVG